MRSSCAKKEKLGAGQSKTQQHKVRGTTWQLADSEEKVASAKKEGKKCNGKAGGLRQP